MNGTSTLLVFVLIAALVAGMVFMVNELNHSAEEILADRQTIQDLQAGLEQARTSSLQQQQTLSQQQQTIEGLKADLAQKSADLAAAGKSLQSAQADSAALRLSLQNEQALRARFETQNADLANQLRSQQERAAGLEARVNVLVTEKASLQQQIAAQDGGAQPVIPVTGPKSSSATLPLAASAAGLGLLGGGAALVRRLRAHVN
jgi:chromosome segregation ATPase